MDRPVRFCCSSLSDRCRCFRGASRRHSTRMARASGARASRFCDRPAHPLTSRCAHRDRRRRCRPHRSELPTDQPSDRTPRRSRRSETGHAPSTQSCLRSSRDHRRIHRSGTTTRQPRRQYPLIASDKDRSTTSMTSRSRVTNDELAEEQEVPGLAQLPPSDYADSETIRVSGGVASSRKSPLRHERQLQGLVEAGTRGVPGLLGGR